MTLGSALQGFAEFFPLLISQLRIRETNLPRLKMTVSFANRNTEFSLCCSKVVFKRSGKTGKKLVWHKTLRLYSQSPT